MIGPRGDSVLRKGPAQWVPSLSIRALVCPPYYHCAANRVKWRNNTAKLVTASACSIVVCLLGTFYHSFCITFCPTPGAVSSGLY